MTNTRTQGESVQEAAAPKVYRTAAEIQAAFLRNELTAEEAIAMAASLNAPSSSGTAITFERKVLPAGTQTAPNRAPLVFPRHVVTMYANGKASKDAVSLNETQFRAFLDWLQVPADHEIRKGL